jgi:hypothetical protein
MRPRPNYVIDWRPATVAAVLYAVLMVALGYDLVALLAPMLAAPTP